MSSPHRVAATVMPIKVIGVTVPTSRAFHRCGALESVPMTQSASNALDLPPAFLEKNGADPAFLRALPRLLAELTRLWSLTLGPHYPAISWNYVAPATRADGTRAVLKVSRHVEETRNEIAALRLWDGDGAARLLAADADLGAVLTERLEPGSMLTEVAAVDDDAATEIAAGVLRRLWRAVPERHGLRSLADWCAAYDRNRVALSRGADGFPASLFRRADALRRDLLASTERDSVLHGDLHHANVLRAERDPWLAIDPKGLTGDRCFDLCMFFRNPLPTGVPPAVNRRRLDIFATE